MVIFSYGLFLFAYLFPPDFRNQSPAYVAAAWIAFMVRTFQFHYGLALLVLIVLAAWARKWRMASAALPLVALTVGPAGWSYLPREVPETSGETITVMSVNLLRVNRNTDPIVQEIAAADPDILLLQEYTEHWRAAIGAHVEERYPYAHHVLRGDSFGAALLSKRPFVGEVQTYLPMGRIAMPEIRAVVEIAGRRVAVYNIHLVPPMGMGLAIEHRLQFADLLDLLDRETLPAIVAGDFNFTETSPDASALRRRGFREAHAIAGRGRGTTWPVHRKLRWMPRIRLDHIFLSGGLTASQSKTGVGKGSDHRPVIAKIGFAP